MSASEKLKDLDYTCPSCGSEAHSPLRKALPQIVAVVEAADALAHRVEMLPSGESYAVDAMYRSPAAKLRQEADRIEEFDRLKREFHAALVALDEALQ